jgi:hypothetical protein
MFSSFFRKKEADSKQRIVAPTQRDGIFRGGVSPEHMVLVLISQAKELAGR